MFAPDSATEKIVAEVVELAGPSDAQGLASANIAAFGQTTGDVGAMLVMADPAVVCADHIAAASDRRAVPQNLKPNRLNNRGGGCDFCVCRSAHASPRMLPGESPDRRHGLLRSLSIT
jgi:hypothetical protein